MRNLGYPGSSAPFVFALVSAILINACMYSFIRSFVMGYKKRVRYISFFSFIPSLFTFSVSAIASLSNKFIIPSFSWVLGIPNWVLCLSMTVVAVALCIVHNYIRYEKYNLISRNSIKEAIDRLPMGISIYNHSGVLLLTNRTMNDIAFTLLGDEVKNAFVFEQSLEEKRIVEESDTILYINDAYWIFQKREITLSHGASAYEMIATNITEEYKINLTLREESVVLSKYNQDLRRYRNNIVKVTADEEILNAKIKIHDELGELLLVTKNMQENATSAEKESLIRSWDTTYKQLRNYEAQEETVSFIDDIKEAASSIGVSIITHGEIPNLPIINTMIHECLTNTIKHGKGNEMTIISSLDGRYFILSCSNNGELAKTYKFKGGLKSLQDLAKKYDGKLEIVKGDRFTIQLSIPKERMG